MAADIHEQLTKYLTDAHSIEQQALAQLRTAPDLAGDPEIAAAFRQHLTETETHERIAQLGWEPTYGADEALRELVAGMGESAGTATPPLDPKTSGPARVRELLTTVGQRGGE